MTTRHHSAVRFLSLAVSAALAGASLMHPLKVFAEPAALAVEGLQQPYYGQLNDDNVYVRSGPSDVYYATTKLNKGTQVTVVAVRNDWLKIVPPDNSYCYVAKAYVEKRGDGSVGRVVKPELNVRAGSSLNGLKTTVQTSLAEGDDVKILGEESEYFKIAPPPGAYLYVKKVFVDPIPAVVAAPAPVVPPAAKISEPIASAPIPVAPAAPVAPPQPVQTVAPVAVAPAPAPVAPVPAPIPAPVVAAAPIAPAPVVSVTPAPSTQPAVAVAAVPATQPAVAMAPATQPAQPTADAKFDSLETQFLDATNLPLDQQPVDKLLTDYVALSTDASLPTSMHRIVDMRVSTLQLRSDARTQYLAAQKMQADAKARQLALKAENDELAQRVKSQEISIFTALGTLRISSLQQSGTTMYRLTDPGTGRTLLYIRSNDTKYTGLLNQFIGVKGDITEDTTMNLKVIVPTDAQPVDQTKVNTTITATVIPPSLLQTAAAGVVGN